MGTPAYAVPALAELVSAGHEVACAYSQPPRPSGRGQRLRPSPVQEYAGSLGIPVRTPRSLKGADEQAAFAALDADVGVVVAYGLILPQAVLDAPRHGCLNLHGSLLPRWRGAAPVQRAIMAGDARTGVQLMQMEAGLDTGPVLMSEAVPITPDDTYETLSETLSRTGADLLPRGLAVLERGGLTPAAQAEDGVTYASKVGPEEARVDWSRPAEELGRHVRGLSPFPGAWTTLTRGGEQARLKLLHAAPGGRTDAAPGTVTGTDGALEVACGDGRALRVTRAQRPGARAQGADELLRGWRVPVGTQLT